MLPGFLFLVRAPTCLGSVYPGKQLLLPSVRGRATLRAPAQRRRRASGPSRDGEEGGSRTPGAEVQPWVPAGHWRRPPVSPVPVVRKTEPKITSV